MPLLVRPLGAQAPFSLHHAVDFLRSFPPCGGDFVLRPGSLRGVLDVEGFGVGFEIREPGPGLDVELALETPTADRAVVERAAFLARSFVGADDCLAPFYAAAAGDVPEFRSLVRSLHGLHHVRFATLCEVTVHAVLAQRAPILVAARQKRRIRDAFGRGVGDLVAFPSFERLLPLTALDFHRVIGHAKKAAVLPKVLAAVHALGESTLRQASYERARAALEAIPGIGPFSAAFILLRGLGRMDDVPLEMPSFRTAAQRVYGTRFDAQRVRARYGASLGYWAHYLKRGASPS